MENCEIRDNVLVKSLPATQWLCGRLTGQPMSKQICHGSQTNKRSYRYDHSWRGEEPRRESLARGTG